MKMSLFHEAIENKFWKYVVPSMVTELLGKIMSLWMEYLLAKELGLGINSC